MHIVKTIAATRERLDIWRLAGDEISFVPTMGNLHAGHLALVKKAKSLSARVVVSLFVNPLQFDQESDLVAYPRTLESDLEKLLKAGVDAVFTPDVAVLYPAGLENMTKVEVPHLSSILEGAARPGHFTGVSTVVNKLLNIVRPHSAVFGAKDFQQLMVIKRMVADLDMPVEIHSLPTVRDEDGLAMSSRNGYLNENERPLAPRLFATLSGMAEKLCCAKMNSDYSSISTDAFARLKSEGFAPDYVEIRRVKDLKIPEKGDVELIILAAAWLGKARLIDNFPVNLKNESIFPIIKG